MPTGTEGVVCSLMTQNSIKIARLIFVFPVIVGESEGLCHRYWLVHLAVDLPFDPSAPNCRTFSFHGSRPQKRAGSLCK